MHDVWPSPGLVHDIYIYMFGFSCPLTEFCLVQNSHYVQVLRSPIMAALLHGTPGAGVSKTLRCDARNGIIELSHRAARHLYSAGRPSRWHRSHILVKQKLFSLSVTPAEALRENVEKQSHGLCATAKHLTIVSKLAYVITYFDLYRRHFTS